MVKIRNAILHTGYVYVVKPVFFLFDPEDVHDWTNMFGQFLGSNPLTRTLTGLCFNYKNKILRQEIRGIKFENPVGLAAGFDKNAQLTQILPHVGFGHAEVGSITGEYCAGNPKPRVWRLPKSKTLQIYYGLKNDGCEAIKKRLQNKKFKIPIGTSIAKTNCEATADTKVAIKDYVKAYKAMQDIGAYSTINISCPNAYGGQPFTDEKKLDALLKAICKEKKTKPMFIKLSPDLTDKEVDAIIKLAGKYKIDGFIATNLTKKFKGAKVNEPIPSKSGGLSGKAVDHLSDKLIATLYKKGKGKFVIMGCGGVMSAEDAYRKIRKGASLIQMITGMIFEGPQVVSQINRGLVDLLKKDGFHSIADAVGVDA